MNNSKVLKTAWMGVGISSQYIPVLKKIDKNIDCKKYSRLIIVIADKISFKYNNTRKNKLIKDLFRLASGIKIKDCKVEVVGWDFIYNDEQYLDILKKYERLFDKNLEFKNEVLSLVEKNRNNMEENEKMFASGYVLEEISSTVLLNKNGFIKIGPEMKEKDFDELSVKWSGLSVRDFERF